MKVIRFWIAVIVNTFIVSVSIKALSQHSFGNERSQCEATLTAKRNRVSAITLVFDRDLVEKPGFWWITLRQGPGTNYRSNGYGLVGDRVYILTVIPPDIDYKKDSQGYGWYRVGFPKSGVSGWIREDFLRVKCAQIND